MARRLETILIGIHRPGSDKSYLHRCGSAKRLAAKAIYLASAISQIIWTRFRSRTSRTFYHLLRILGLRIRPAWRTRWHQLVLSREPALASKWFPQRAAAVTWIRDTSSSWSRISCRRAFCTQRRSKRHSCSETSTCSIMSESLPLSEARLP